MTILLYVPYKTRWLKKSDFLTKQMQEVMVIMEDSDVLLEELASKTGCTFLSDLHQPCKLSQIGRAVETIPYNLYSLQSWKDAASYISSEKCMLGTEAEIRTFLSNYCKEHSDI